MDKSRENNGRWKGGRFKHGSGYIMVKAWSHPHRNNQNYVWEHRLIMEKKLGRYLKPEEQIHHINEIKDDNRIENLKLFANRSEHTKHHHPKQTICKKCSKKDNRIVRGMCRSCYDKQCRKDNSEKYKKYKREYQRKWRLRQKKQKIQQCENNLLISLWRSGRDSHIIIKMEKQKTQNKYIREDFEMKGGLKNENE